ncbi:sigma-54 interaction domain-containing protein [Thermodesulfobacteriota bacterium]
MDTSINDSIQQYQDKVELITREAKMRELLRTAQQIAMSNCNVIISGKSGTGKELLARYIHENSNRSQGSLVSINCGVFTEELLSSELFGHEKGSFTGAYNRKKGLIEIASGGSLFLDEITEMPLSMQVRLLRVIQEKEIIRVGGIKRIPVDVRFIAASNRDIHDAIATGHLRDDLFFRLNVVSLHIPPLSERKSDIPLLCTYFLNKFTQNGNTRVAAISPKVINTLMEYHFPGNVRELANIIERGLALASGPTIEPKHLPDDFRYKSVQQSRPMKHKGSYKTLEEHGMEYILMVLNEVEGNKSMAAKFLGLDRSSLWRKLKRFEMETNEAKPAYSQLRGA